MSEDTEAREYLQFQADLLTSKFKGTHTEMEMTDRLIELYQKGNRYAKRGLEAAKLTYVPDSRMANSVWGNGAIYNMIDAGSPPQTGPKGTDHHGLWRDDEVAKTKK